MDNFILLQISADQFLLGTGTLSRADRADPGRFSFYTPDFYLQEPLPWIIPSNTTIVTKEELLSWIAKHEVFLETIFSWNPFESDDFEVSFNKIQKEISEGNIQKVVPVLFETELSINPATHLHSI